MKYWLMLLACVFCLSTLPAFAAECEGCPDCIELSTDKHANISSIDHCSSCIHPVKYASLLVSLAGQFHKVHVPIPHAHQNFTEHTTPPLLEPPLI